MLAARPSPGVGRWRGHEHSAQDHHPFHRARRRVAAARAAATADLSPSPTGAAASAHLAPPPPPPTLLLLTKNKACLTTALEAGRLTAAVFTAETRELAAAWRGLARFEALLLDPERGTLTPLDDDDDEPPGGAGAPAGAAAAVVGRWARVPDAEALRGAEASLSSVDGGLRYVVMDASGASGGGGGKEQRGGGDDEADDDAWRLIPAENLVAFAQQQPWWRRSRTRLLATARTAADAGALLGSLEAGTDGVVMVTDDPAEVRAAGAVLERRARAASPPLLLSRASPPIGGSRGSPSPSPSRRRNDSPHPPHPVYDEAVVTRVQAVGMADRACVDLAQALLPGQGLLVGCFARALFLVASERDETAYIAARPFRVNAGPLAQYVLAEGPSALGGGGRTAYLSELRCGRTVAVAGADGRLAEAEAVVARVKVERRPVVLVEAETFADDGQPPERHSVLLQNAETVKLVGPSGGGSSSDCAWRAVSVAQLAVGDVVYVLRQPAARHTGLAVDEGVSER